MTLRLSERSEFLTMIYLSVQHQNKRNRKPKFNIQNTVLNYNLFSIDIARHITWRSQQDSQLKTTERIWEFRYFGHQRI